MLYTVTYLQHHSHDTKIYDDSTWSYVTAAFETVDRTYGKILGGLVDIDLLHHHISDGHVVHHLFFTKIPHYNLKLATKSLVEYLKKEGLDYLYQHNNTPDFATRVVKYMYEFQTRAKLVTMENM